MRKLCRLWDLGIADQVVSLLGQLDLSRGLATLLGRAGISDFANEILRSCPTR